MKRRRPRNPNAFAFVVDLDRKRAALGNDPLPAADMVRAARIAGFKLEAPYVHRVRYLARRGGDRPTVQLERAGTAEQAFVELACELGLGNAATLLQRVRARVQALAVDGAS